MKKYCGYCGSKIAGSSIVSEFQAAIEANPYLKGQMIAREEDLIEGSRYTLLFSAAAERHIKERHASRSKPGSLLKAGLDLKAVAEDLLKKTPNETDAHMVKWISINTGSTIGYMGIAWSDPEEVEEMEDYIMPDGSNEHVKIKKGKRKPTTEISMITARAGELSNGTEGLILVTMFPGGMKIDGHDIPINRNEFKAKGFYFVVE